MAKLSNIFLVLGLSATPIYLFTDLNWLIYVLSPCGIAALMCSGQAKQALRNPYYLKE